jgi:hypothetical protein
MLVYAARENSGPFIMTRMILLLVALGAFAYVTVVPFA